MIAAKTSSDTRVFEFRLSQKPGCEVSSAEGRRDAAADGAVVFPPGNPAQAESIPDLGLPAYWDIPASETEQARKSHFFSATAGLLKKLPVQHVAPLNRGGIRFFKGPRTIGGYYRAHSSTVCMNAAVYPAVFPIALLHEIGHLVHLEVAGPTARRVTDLSWLQIGPFRIRKFWKGHDSFLTPYSAVSPEEDFAEIYGGYAAGLFQQKEWLEIGFGKLSICPVCRKEWFALDLEDGDRGICSACDTMYVRRDNQWTPYRRNLAAGRAAMLGMPWTPPGSETTS